MKMTDETRERLKQVELRLKARGVKDVKFTWDPTKEMNLEHMGQDAAHALEQFLDGKTIPAGPIGDLPNV